MKIKALIKWDMDFQKIIDDLNNESKVCTYKLLKQKNLSIPPDVLIVIFEILENIGISGTYDLMKMALLELVSKIHPYRSTQSKEKETSIIVIADGKRTEICLPFELNEEQKNRIVDGAISELFNN